MKKAFFLIILMFLSGCSMFDKNMVKVVSITDGDTIVAKNRKGEEIRVRLACIDAPEMSEVPWGKQAKDRLAQLVKPNSFVKLNVVDTDHYNRVVAELYKGGLVNLKLVKEGKAFVYEHYLDNCNGQEYLKAQESAKKWNKGIWKNK